MTCLVTRTQRYSVLAGIEFQALQEILLFYPGYPVAQVLEYKNFWSSGAHDPQRHVYALVSVVDLVLDQHATTAVAWLIWGYLELAQ